LARSAPTFASHRRPLDAHDRLDRAGRLVVCGVLLAGPSVLAFASGGFFDSPRTVAGVVAWVLVAIAALTLRDPLPSDGWARAALVGLGLLAAWVAISQARAPIEGAARNDLERDLLYLGTLLAAAAAFRPRTLARAVEPALALGALVVVGYGVSGRLLPGVIQLDHSATAAGRLEQPLTYWNAMGALAAIGLVLCCRLAGDRTRPPAVRAAAAAAASPLGLGLYLTFSRGALVAAAVGIVVLVVLAPDREQLRAAAIALAAAGLVVIAASFLSGVESLAGSASHRRAEGIVMLVVLAAVVPAAVAGQLAIGRAEEGGRLGVGLLDRVPPARAVAIALAALVLAVPVVGALAEGRGQLRSPLPEAGAARLKDVGSNRYAYWRVALDAFSHHPLVGTGPSGFGVEWARERRIDENVRDAHSLYLETLAELGLVGLAALALLLAGMMGVGAGVGARDPRLAAGLVAGLAVWATHAAVDWDWEMPAVTLPALVLVGTLIARAGVPGAD
jgi:hypothetical protein